MSPRPLFGLAVAALLGLTACATDTPYQPFGFHGASEGYSDRELSPGHWRVSFAGNELTGRDTVETYLLYRSAELTVAQGYDWFSPGEPQTATLSHERRYSSAGPFGGVWSPDWQYRQGDRLRPWRTWDPWGAAPFFDTQTVTAYAVSADIAMGHGAKPANDPDALDAREVLKTLGPQVVRPR
ncbi:MAG TPA: hypothetical protein VG939_03430 [Caulobacteraceae bacterium]|nr:hypothetical protein [Caulobacteraceae bacterium]